MSIPEKKEKSIMNGLRLIATERERQVLENGCTPEVDDQHTDGEMALVAALLASPDLLYKQVQEENGTPTFCDPWPESWDRRWDRRPYRDRNGRPNHDVNIGTQQRIRQLEKAGALIAAEIDRLLRIQDRAAKHSVEKSAAEL